MEALKALMKDFDPAALMPDLTTVLGKVEAGMRLAVMIGPMVLLVMKCLQIRFILTWLPAQLLPHLQGLLPAADIPSKVGLLQLPQP